MDGVVGIRGLGNRSCNFRIFCCVLCYVEIVFLVVVCFEKNFFLFVLGFVWWVGEV